MQRLVGEAHLSSHQVTNQPQPLGDLDLWADDPTLRAILPDPDGALARYGATLGLLETRERGLEANRTPPRLASFDASGRRIDEVLFPPDYHHLMALSKGAGYAALPWEGAPAGHSRHAAMTYLASQIEPGHCCPLTMTYAGQALLAAHDLPLWSQQLRARAYDPSVRPLADKSGATLGMAMTEKQGGSDLRATSTRAERDGGGWRLTGHKWFCSAPMSDGLATLAQTPAGLTCFLVPRWLEGARNGIRLQRLKDKLGNRSNASAEIEYERAFALQLGEEGNGIRTILEMVHHTRLDTAIAPVGLMRGALRLAGHWASQRQAFGKSLAQQPLMQGVLADLALDWLASLHLTTAVAQSFDDPSREGRAFARIAVALAKYLTNKLCPLVVVEAMEVLGGAGYIEDSSLPLFYREAPLNGIWEGSGNIICLDVLRSLNRDTLAKAALYQCLDRARGQLASYDQAHAAHLAHWSDPAEAHARSFTERTAWLLAAAVMIERGAGDLAETLLHSRLIAPQGRMAGSSTTLDLPLLLRAGYGLA